MYIELNENEFKVTAEGLTIELLPKEFALFEFLYRNKGQTFSREQLLDKVWPLEYPVERTVDDHIYRLRKKLVSLEGLVLKTVRGFGYSLLVRNMDSAVEVNPTTRDPELNQRIRDVFGKYHTYGQGRSMLALARQQDVLGYELAPFYSIYIHFVEGDLEWLLYTQEVPLAERMYYLVLCHAFLGEPEKSLRYCEQVLDQQLLHPNQHMEMKILNILDVYALAGQVDKALERLQLTYTIIAEPDYENFVPSVAITEMFLHLVKGTEDSEIALIAEKIEDECLTTKPFLREIGSYKVVKGLWELRGGEGREAEKLLDEGLHVLDRSGFIPLRMYSLLRIRYFSHLFPKDGALLKKYRVLYEKEQERFGFRKLIGPLEAMMRKTLNSL
ncbi:hypothetical protein GCM10010912_51430 [Paenibacillus albidus]|uniref:OmpR/PhoB-type domain-containing protein n=1 Tax=Paenibacillus albidus TaxID=2041023 RepID=A0A917CWV1_9BACL|nr:winged helix-turn-helix domain-containing protein [Paenibacillus albidus]GGG00249.1 hypothetical protein GCM10010912_51430 [Paenibacillus albidus]